MRKGGTTTLLKRHLKALHRDKYEELLRLEKQPRLATARDLKTQLGKAKKQSLKNIHDEIHGSTGIHSKGWTFLAN
ncbi:hypothetical protein J437_LFUL013475 [Ladona fulva]|uniref:Uncharacterized protein n=1 Tax=Ladona fulva TaxID=123851 RepID=A0A8K0KMF9_LADFU|nr:hypothetical protein J437_LFUL013475 [Ladona fulva]